METDEKVERQPVHGGLRLPRHVGMGKQEIADAHSNRDTIDDVEKELAVLGLTPIQQPAFARPSLTAEQLTTMVNKDYTTLYAQHLAWYNFTHPLVARIKARSIGISNEMTDIETRIRKDLRGKNKLLPKEEKFNEKDINDEIWSDPRYMFLTREKQKLDQKKLELEAYLEVMDSSLKVISRQVEIRKLELEGGKTENAMPSRGGRFPSLRQP